MVSKDEMLAAMVRECEIVVHLHGKIPPGGADFRFTPPQRSTLELLRYLSYVGLGFATAVVTGDWSTYTTCEKESKHVAFRDIPAAMERQKRGLRELFASLTEEELQTKTFTQPWGERMPIGAAILVLAYASLVAYRMQLFLQAKAAGNASLATPNCWAGVN